MLAQCRRVRQMRRSDQREWTFRLRQPREQWHRQLQFTDAGRDIDDLAEIRAWPAAAGQCGVETRVAGRHRAQRRLAIALPEPRIAQQGLQCFGACRHPSTERTSCRARTDVATYTNYAPFDHPYHIITDPCRER